MTEHNDQLIHKIIRLPKDESAFMYFQLESNEGLCFYSTLDQSLKEPYRDIEVFAHLSLKTEVDHLLHNLGRALNLEVILDETISDSAEAVQKFGKKGKKHMRQNEK